MLLKTQKSTLNLKDMKVLKFLLDEWCGGGALKSRGKSAIR
jgi:hypothetical protein